MPLARSTGNRSRYCFLPPFGTAPVCSNKRSASVLLPWSTCAMIPNERMRSRGIARYSSTDRCAARISRSVTRVEARGCAFRPPRASEDPEVLSPGASRTSAGAEECVASHRCRHGDVHGRPRVSRVDGDEETTPGTSPIA